LLPEPLEVVGFADLVGRELQERFGTWVSELFGRPSRAHSMEEPALTDSGEFFNIPPE